MSRHLILLLFTVSMIISCKDTASDPGADSTRAIVANTSADVDERFDVFVSKFSNDSVFQISRIKFPMQVQEVELNDSLEMISRTVRKSEHRTMNFSPPEFKGNIDNYTQEFKTVGNRSTIEIRGIDNGIMIDFFFEKINGKWMLISWTDSST